MNWGYKLAILYGSFACLILFMVYRAMQEDVSLVTPDYYTQTLTYQNEIDLLQKTNTTGKKPMVTAQPEANQVLISFPVADAVEGKLWLYRPSTIADDVHQDFAVAVGEPVVLDMAGKPSGLWRIKISYTAGGQDYLSEQVLTY